GPRGAGRARRAVAGGAGLVRLRRRRLRLPVRTGRAGPALGGAAGGERVTPTGAEVAAVAPRPRHLMTRLRWSTLGAVTIVVGTLSAVGLRWWTTRGTLPLTGPLLLAGVLLALRSEEHTSELQSRF